MIPFLEKNASKFVIIVSKTACSNETSLAVEVKLAIACHAKLYCVGVMAHAKSPKMALHVRG